MEGHVPFTVWLQNSGTFVSWNEGTSKKADFETSFGKKKFILSKGDTAPRLHPFNVPVKMDTEITASILERGVAHVHSEWVDVRSEQMNVALK